MIVHGNEAGSAVLVTPSFSASEGIGRAFLGTLFRHRWLIAGITVATLAAVWVYSHWETPLYEVTSVLRVSEKRPPVPNVYEDLTLQEDAVSTEMEMLQSRSLATEVVRDNALQLHVMSPRNIGRGAIVDNIIIAPDAGQGAYRLTRVNGGFLVQDRTTKRSLRQVQLGERVHVPGVSFVLLPAAAQLPHIDFQVNPEGTEVANFMHVVTVDRPVRDADVITVAYRGTDPTLMVPVLNDMTARFIDRRQDTQSSEAKGAVQFFHQQLDTLSKQLAISEDSLQNYREREQVIEPSEEAHSQIDRFVSAQAERNTLNAERLSLAQLISAADSAQMGDTTSSIRYRQLIASPSLLKNQAADGLLTSLLTLENQRGELLTRRTRRDPDVQALTARIDAIDNEIHTLAVTYLAGLDKQLNVLDQTLATYNGQLEHIPQQELGYARLERNTKVLSDAYTLLQTRLKDAEIAEGVQDPSVQVVDAAVLPTKPLRPNLPLNLGVGLLLGLMLGIGAAVIWNARDPSVRTRADIRLAAGLPVIGLIPSAETARRMMRRPSFPRRRGLQLPETAAQFTPVPVASANASANGAANVYAESIMTDAYARLEANIARLAHEQPGRIFLVTSAMAAEGKTTSAVNLTRALAKRGQRVLLVDADLRNSRLDMMLGGPPVWGMSDVLAGQVDTDTTIRKLPNSEFDNAMRADYISSGTQRCRDSAAVLGSARFREILELLRPNYDVVIVDTPPLIVPDAIILSQVVDGVIVVVRSGMTARAALGYAVQQLRVVGAPMIGAVLNDIDFLRDWTYDDAFGYYGAAYAYATTDSVVSGS